MKLSPQQRAKLRCCASCLWIYEGPSACPMCGFASYGARYIYGDKAYRLKFTQMPWLKRKLARYQMRLQKVIDKNTPKKTRRSENGLSLLELLRELGE
jgi:hypothetical protein